MFKVVTDQLKVSQGWVRCGHCAEVFDATDQLQPYAPPLVQTTDSSPVPDANASGTWLIRESVGDNPVKSLPVESPSVASIPRAESGATAADSLAKPIRVARGEREQLAEARSSSLKSALSAAPHVSVLEQQPINAALQTVLPNEPSSIANFGEEEDLPVHDVSFVRNAQREEFWRTPKIRRLMVLMLLGMGCLLLFQFAVQQRDTLVARYPAWASVPTALCASVGCIIKPVQHIDNVVIDSSSFVKLDGNFYRLGFVLKNTSALALAMPSLELTLTDSQEQALIRRVLTPAELGAPSRTLESGQEFTGHVEFRAGSDLPFMAAANTAADSALVTLLKIVGYRVIAFYP